jgi:hypothetical protein
LLHGDSKIKSKEKREIIWLILAIGTSSPLSHDPWSKSPVLMFGGAVVLVLFAGDVRPCLLGVQYRY